MGRRPAGPARPPGPGPERRSTAAHRHAYERAQVTTAGTTGWYV
ncbi:hypothetical protein [Kitasatospora sp. NPDC001547]